MFLDGTAASPIAGEQDRAFFVKQNVEGSVMLRHEAEIYRAAGAEQRFRWQRTCGAFGTHAIASWCSI